MERMDNDPRLVTNQHREAHRTIVTEPNGDNGKIKNIITTNTNPTPSTEAYNETNTRY